MPSCCNGVHQGSPGTFSPVQKPACRRLASRHGNKLLAIITTRLAGMSYNLPGREPCSGRRRLESRRIPPCRRSGPGRGAFGSGRCHLVLPGGHLEPWQQMGWQQERGWGRAERLSCCGISWKEAAGESAPAARPSPFARHAFLQGLSPCLRWSRGEARAGSAAGPCSALSLPRSCSSHLWAPAALAAGLGSALPQGPGGTWGSSTCRQIRT